MADRQPPSPFSQFTLFKALSETLYEQDWYMFIECWNAMLEANVPIQEYLHNLSPYFGNAKRLLGPFKRYLKFAENDDTFSQTLSTVLMSTPLLIRVQEILGSASLFSGYIAALKLDQPSASHTQVMQSLETFLQSLPEPLRLEISKVFAEAEASNSLGLSNNSLDAALQLLHQDTQLYIDILSTLQLNQTKNLAWDDVVTQIRIMVQERKPQALEGIDVFLQNLLWGEQQYYEDEDEEDVEDDDEDQYQEQQQQQQLRPQQSSSASSSTLGVPSKPPAGALPEGEEYELHYAAFLNDLQKMKVGNGEQTQQAQHHQQRQAVY